MNRIVFIFLVNAPICLFARMAPRKADATQRLSKAPSVQKSNITKKSTSVAPTVVTDLPERWKPVAVQYEARHDEMPGTVMVNRIEVEVDGPSGPAIITTLDVERRQFDGQPHTIEDLVIEHIKSQKSQKTGSVISKEDVLRYLRTATGDKNFSEEKLALMGKPWSFTIDELYDELIRMYSANMSGDNDIRLAMERPVAEQDIEAYYQAHPVQIKGTLFLQTALIPASITAVERMLANNEEISWGPTLDIDDEDVAEDKAFFFEMTPGEIKLVPESGNTRAYKLVNRCEAQVVPLAERKDEIVGKIREERFMQAVEMSKEALFAEAKVFYKQ